MSDRVTMDEYEAAIVSSTVRRNSVAAAARVDGRLRGAGWVQLSTRSAMVE